MEKIFGENWRTTFWAVVAGLAGFISTYPELLEPIPDYWEDLIKKALAFLVGGGLIKLGLSSADLKKSKEENSIIKEKLDEIAKNEKF